MMTDADLVAAIVSGDETAGEAGLARLLDSAAPLPSLELVAAVEGYARLKVNSLREADGLRLCGVLGLQAAYHLTTARRYAAETLATLEVLADRGSEEAAARLSITSQAFSDDGFGDEIIADARLLRSSAPSAAIH